MKQAMLNRLAKWLAERTPMRYYLETAVILHLRGEINELMAEDEKAWIEINKLVWQNERYERQLAEAREKIANLSNSSC